MKKKYFVLSVVIALVVAMSLTFTGCSLTGLSAYEIAVKNGFSGTEQEWLASLKGTNGRDGENFNSGYTAYSLYQEMVDKGSYTGTFSDFVKEYFSSATGTEAVANNTLFSAVDVVATFSVKTTTGGWPYGYNTTTTKATSSGSGVFYSVDKENGDALIITNFHVVYNTSEVNSDKLAESINVYIYGKQSDDYAITCEYVGGTSTFDIAVLKVSGSDIIKNSSVTAVSFADSDEASVGETVYALGNSKANGLSLTKGILSVDSEYITMTDPRDNTTTYRVMRFDAAINSGNSGGGLFNAEGKLLGIVNAKNIEENVEGMYYALPSAQVKPVVENIIEYCLGSSDTTFKRPIIGVQLKTTSSSAVLDDETGLLKIVEDVEVEAVTSGSKADGKIEKGDKIVSVSVNGVEKKVTRSFVLVDTVMGTKDGDTVTINVLRDGNAVAVDIAITTDCLTAVD